MTGVSSILVQLPLSVNMVSLECFDRVQLVFDLHELTMSKSPTGSRNLLVCVRVQVFGDSNNLYVYIVVLGGQRCCY